MHWEKATAWASALDAPGEPDPAAGAAVEGEPVVEGDLAVEGESAVEGEPAV